MTRKVLNQNNSTLKAEIQFSKAAIKGTKTEGRRDFDRLEYQHRIRLPKQDPELRAIVLGEGFPKGTKYFEFTRVFLSKMKGCAPIDIFFF